MEKLPEMSSREKFHKTFQAVSSYQHRIPEFVAKRLGGEAVVELISFWQAGLVPVPEHAWDEEKYEAAYNNWQWIGRCNLEFIEEQLGKNGLEAYIHGEIQQLSRSLSELDMAGARLLGALAPQLGFRSMAEQILHEMQWMTPVTLVAGSKKGLLATASPCKMMETPGMQRQGCEVNCHRILRGVAVEQYQVRMDFHNQGDGCRISLSPLVL